jgi:EAL domain-containing protein (putative c-di-GMP-specific phosphodiesterase class I)
MADGRPWLNRTTRRQPKESSIACFTAACCRTVFPAHRERQNRAVVGYEGLMRGPAGSVLESPSDLLKEAYRTNRVVEFDWCARAAARRAALQASLTADDLLFLSIRAAGHGVHLPTRSVADRGNGHQSTVWAARISIIADQSDGSRQAG